MTGRFNADALVDEATRAPWEFTLHGRAWRVPHIADLTLEQQMLTDSGRPDLAVADAEVWDDGDPDADTPRPAGWVPAGDECAKALRKMRGAARGAWVVAWLAHAGMLPGESDASSRS